MSRLSAAIALAAALGMTGPASAQDEQQSSEQLFESLDGNKDGRLAGDEVPEEQRRFFERLVRVGDGDNDGILTREEFTTALEKEDAPVTAPAGEPERDGRRRGPS